jgi:hypothetical protein
MPVQFLHRQFFFQSRAWVTMSNNASCVLRQADEERRESANRQLRAAYIGSDEQAADTTVKVRVGRSLIELFNFVCQS